MSGHSKWHNIAAKKGKTDAARGKIFTKLGRELLIAVKEGGADPASNSKLRDVIAKCKANNMPNDNIERSIKRAAGEGSNAHYEDVVYEGYGPNGAQIIVEATTDNRNRTAGDIRHIFDKFGGNLGATGSVSWSFDKKGVIVIEKASTKLSEDDVMMEAIELGADNFESEDEFYEITTSPDDFSKVREGLEAKGLEFVEAEVKMVPQNYVSLDADAAKKMRLIIDNLEDNDDVSEVWHNWDEEGEE
jgi:YebC/PmpR family DNA-binding regulatory protein